MTKPYGRRGPLRANLENYGKFHGSWWEEDFSDVSKGRARQGAKREIAAELLLMKIYKEGDAMSELERSVLEIMKSWSGEWKGLAALRNAYQEANNRECRILKIHKVVKALVKKKEVVLTKVDGKNGKQSHIYLPVVT